MALVPRQETSRPRRQETRRAEGRSRTRAVSGRRARLSRFAVFAQYPPWSDACRRARAAQYSPSPRASPRPSGGTPRTRGGGGARPTSSSCASRCLATYCVCQRARESTSYGCSASSSTRASGSLRSAASTGTMSSRHAAISCTRVLIWATTGFATTRTERFTVWNYFKPPHAIDSMSAWSASDFPIRRSRMDVSCRRGRAGRPGTYSSPRDCLGSLTPRQLIVLT